MKFTISILLTAIFAFAAGLYMPWWIIAPTAFIVSILIRQRPLLAFVTGFTGIFLCWLTVALIRNSANDGILGSKVAAILPLGGSTIALILIASLVGGLVGGLSACSAAFLRVPADRDSRSESPAV